LLAWAWAIIAVGVGLNALIKSNQQQSKLRKQVPAGTTLDINVSDVFNTGVIVTTISACIALITTLLLLLHLRRPTLLTSSLKIQGAILAFFTVWLFATQIPFTHFFRTRSAIVRAFINGQELPSSIVQSVERSLGTTSVYKRISYLRLVAILPWFTIFFSLLATFILFRAASRARRETAPVSPTSPTETRGTSSGEGMVEKERVAHGERRASTEKERVVERGVEA
jgi:hypothetical protein